MSDTADARLLARIKDLEDRLLHGDPAEPDLAEKLLADGFEEIAAGGESHGREEVLDWLGGQDTAGRWELSDFRVRRVGADTVLAIYRARRTGRPVSVSRGSLHTSLWRRSDNEYGWQLLFHQTTRLE